jgi:putative ABC transport system substrate-binding protein
VLQLDDGDAAREAVAALGEGLRQSGLEPDRDYALTIYSAHGNPALLPALATQAAQEGAHTLVAVGTPALRTALAAAGSTPIVFTAVADPWAVGVRRASWWRRWLPFLLADAGPPVTGAYAAPGFGDLLGMSEGVVTDGHYGAVVAGGDDDALAYQAGLRTTANWQSRQVDFELARDPADLGAAAARLCGQGVKGLIALGDPTSTAGFDRLAEAARVCRIPILGTLRVHAVSGAVLTAARQPAEAARAAGRMVGRLAAGSAPADIPVAEVAQPALIINAAAAEQLDLGIPLSLLERADEVLEN